MRVVEFVPGYKVSDCGQVWGPRGHVLKLCLRGNCNYLSINCCRPKRKTRPVHVLVARAFVQNPRPDIFFQVDHIDQNKLNNHASNLRWLNGSLNQLNNDAKGASKNGNRFKSEVQVNKTRFYLGTYDTEKEASEVSKKFRKEQFDILYKNLVKNGSEFSELPSPVQVSSRQDVSFFRPPENVDKC